MCAATFSSCQSIPKCIPNPCDKYRCDNYWCDENIDIITIIAINIDVISPYLINLGVISNDDANII